MKSFKILLVLASFLFLAGYAHDGFAQNYPTKPIRVVVPHGAGGAAELVIRTLQKPLQKELKGTLFIECIGGGNTKMGVNEVIKAEPDGHTLAVFGHGAVMGYYFSGTYDYKVWEKVTPIASLQELAYGLFEVRSDSPFKAWADLVGFAKKNPGKKLTCGGPGAGGVQQLNVVEAAKAAGVQFSYVPFAGGGPSTIALLGGHVDFRICLPSEAAPNIRDGRTRGLAVAYDRRLTELPDVPTFKEANVLGGLVIRPFSFDLWGPPNLPEELVNQIAKATEKAMKDPEFLEFCRKTASPGVFKDAKALKENMKYYEENVGPLLLAAFPRK